MNQYPGFVPMVVPQHFMMAMPGMPLQGIQPGHPAIQQMMPGSMAVAHAGGMQVATTAAALAQGMPMAQHQAAPMGLNALAALQERGQFLGVPAGQGFPGMGMPAMPTATEEALEPEIVTMIDSATTLDDFNCDLNLILDDDGYGGHTLNQPSGFCFTWAGSRATHGVCKGKAFFEVHITEHLPVDFGDDHSETNPHVVRIGWSIDSSPFQLGEEPWSYGYGGTGKFSANNKFSDYGERFEVGDVIGAMVDLDERPATISYTKNGKWLGVALPMHTYPVGNKDMALFPHILSKNCRFKVNFGQIDPWFSPPPMYQYIGQLPDKVRGMQEPERMSDCEMIMIVGLPGAGKTTWGMNMYKSHPEKRYNIIGTDTLIDKMRVMGLPRKRNYHGRWDVLINKASQCLNKLFNIAGKKKRNYILDQTNVYPSARKRKMKNFPGFYKIAAVLQPDDAELMKRSHKRTFEDGKFVPEVAVLEMKANFTLPEDRDNLYDRIDFVELPREQCVSLVDQYNNEGQQKRPPREAVFKHDNFRDSRSQPDFRGDHQQSHRSHSPRQGQGRYPDQQSGYNRGQDQYPGGPSHPGQQRNYEQEPAAKRSKADAGSALDFLKQYGGGEEDPVGQAGILGKPLIKEEPKWDRGQFGWGQQSLPGEPQGLVPKQEYPPMRGGFPPHGDSNTQAKNTSGGFQDQNMSTNWPPFEGGSDQVERKSWQQTGLDQNEPEGYGAQNSARSFGGSENARGFGGSESARSYSGGSESARSYGGGSESARSYTGGSENSRSYGGSDNARNVGGSENARNFSGSESARNYGGSENARNFGGSDNGRNFSGSENARGFSGSENARNFSGQNVPSGYGSQQGGYGKKDSYGGSQDSRNSGPKESWSRGRNDSRGSQDNRGFGQQAMKNFSQDSQTFNQQDTTSYGQDSQDYAQQNSRNSDSKYGSRQESQGFGQDFQGRQPGGFGSQQGPSNNFGNQRPGIFGAPPPLKGQSDSFRDQSSDSPHNRGSGSADSRGHRDSHQESFSQFVSPPPPPPPAQESETDRLASRRTFQHDDASDEKAVGGQRTERVRRRKSKWDTPSDPPSNPEIPLPDGPVPVKVEDPGSDVGSSQYSDKPKQQFDSVSSANDFQRHPPNNSWNDGPNEQNNFQNQSPNAPRGPLNKRGDDDDSQSNQFPGEGQNRGPPFNQGPGNPNMRPPFESRHPQGGPRPQGGNPGPPGVRGPRPGFSPGGPRQFRPRNPSFGGPPTGPGAPQGPPRGPPCGWGGQDRPRFGPRGPGQRPPFNPRFGPDGGQRFPRPMRFQRP